MNPEDFPAPPSYSLPHPELNFLASENRIYDYKNLYAFCNWFAGKLKKYTIDEEHPLALFSHSSDELVFTISACWLLRIPFIPISPKMSHPELQQLLEEIESPVAVKDAKTRSRLRRIPGFTIPSKQLNREAEADPLLFSNRYPKKILGYFQTSGSTGTPKIVPILRRQVLFAAKSSAENFKPDENRYWLLCLPLNHVGGISIILRCLLYHAAIYRMSGYEAGKVAGYLSENKLFQVASLVPTMLKRLLQNTAFHVHGEFKAILLGGGPIHSILIEEAVKRGIPIVTSYGMTETFAQIVANPMLKPSGMYLPKSSVGKIFKPNEIQVRNDRGEVLPANEPGLIWLRGPQVFNGYLRQELTGKAFDKDRWFKTGDIGKLNRFQHLFIETRRTDLIITGGENVNPYEVEEALEKLEGIHEAAVIGIEDEEWGQRLVAFIHPSEPPDEDDDLNTEKIRASLKKSLSGFKVP
ncbi:MAG: AMP-binding protein, partial [Balneolaceae bacterium]